MPQLTQKFGPIPSPVVLNGSGNGTVAFQPNGSNARVSNLYVKVSTSVKQAICTIYLGQVSDSNIVNSTNSGSTGAPAFGAIDIPDGTILYVVWTGGDAGATATATFTGTTIPFDEIGPSSLTWADPVAAGDGSLIYPALKSPNYVPGTTGWALDRNGNIDLNNATIRGELTVTGTGDSMIEIDSSSGLPLISLYPDTTLSTHPNDPSFQPGFVAVNTSSTVNDIYSITLQSPSTHSGGGTESLITLFSSDYTDATPERVLIEAAITEVTGIIRDQPGQAKYQYSIYGAHTFSLVAGSTSGTFTVASFGGAFPGTMIPYVDCNVTSTSGGTLPWNANAVGITNTGFIIRVSSPTAVVAGPNLTLDVAWRASSTN